MTKTSAVLFSQAGDQFVGRPYSEMDCQAFYERMLREVGVHKDLAGSNAWYRELNRNGWVGTPEECKATFGGIPIGATLFILKDDGGEVQRGYKDGLGNASHIGVYIGRMDGAIHSSSSRGVVCYSKFNGKTIPNGGWNRVGLWNEMTYGQPYDRLLDGDVLTGGSSVSVVTLKRGDKGSPVSDLQYTLSELGYDVGEIDGDFGKNTEAAVRAFQNDHGLATDGIVGMNTRAALDAALEHKLSGTAPVVNEWDDVVNVKMTRKQIADLLDSLANSLGGK